MFYGIPISLEGLIKGLFGFNIKLCDQDLTEKSINEYIRMYEGNEEDAQAVILEGTIQEKMEYIVALAEEEEKIGKFIYHIDYGVGPQSLLEKSDYFIGTSEAKEKNNVRKMLQAMCIDKKPINYD